MKKVFAEAGFGNGTFFSTEIEDGGTERRVPHFIRPQVVDDYYLRIWIGKTVLIASTKDGLKRNKKDKRAFKLLLGLAGDSPPRPPASS